MLALVAEDLWKVYGSGERRVEALRGVSIEVREGEVVALLGPNGSGKSTFMGIAAGVVRPTRGRLLVYGGEPYSDAGVRGRISYMPQDYGLYAELTGIENYEFYAALMEVDAKEAKRRLEELSGLLGLGEWFYKRRVSTYSGGMKRKASLALALASNPDLLLLDEPTSGLDPNARREVWGVVDGLRRSGKTVVLATHLFEDAERLADRVVVMRGGEVVAAGSQEDLKRRVGYKYAVDLELREEPGAELLERVRRLGYEAIPAGGSRVTVLGNSPNLLDEVEAIGGAGVVSASMRRVSLGDVYFLLTGVRLE